LDFDLAVGCLEGIVRFVCSIPPSLNNLMRYSKRRCESSFMVRPRCLNSRLAGGQGSRAPENVQPYTSDGYQNIESFHSRLRAEYALMNTQDQLQHFLPNMNRPSKRALPLSQTRSSKSSPCGFNPGTSTTLGRLFDRVRGADVACHPEGDEHHLASCLIVPTTRLPSIVRVSSAISCFHNQPMLRRLPQRVVTLFQLQRRSL